MKTIEECLDIILRQLLANWSKPNNERDNLNAADLLKEFNLPDVMQKHEFFKRLIHRLIKDGYVETTGILYPEADIPYYENLPIITIEGFYFINDEGYFKKKEVNENALILKDDRDRRLSNGTAWLAVGTFLIVAWEIVKTFFLEKHT